MIRPPKLGSTKERNMTGFGRMFFGLLSALLASVGIATVVHRWITERLPIFANPMKLKSEARPAPSVFVAMLAPNSKPYSTAPPVFA